MPKNIVSIEVRGKSYGVRFSYAGSQRRLGLGLPSTSVGKLKALQIAAKIETDILLGTFELEDLQKYKPRYQEIEKNKKAIESNELIELVWGRYVAEKKIEETTRKGHYGMIDKALSMYPKTDVDTFLNAVQNNYAATTQYQIFKGLRAAFNYYAKKYDSKLTNPFVTPASEASEKIKPSERSKKAYRENEARAIILAFKSGQYAKKGYEQNDIHYSRLIEFLFNTGCRLEDALALVFGDITKDSIIFSKAYTKGILKSTKNDKTREFPLSEKLKAIIGKNEDSDPGSLVFPSVMGGYINLSAWRKKYFTRIVNGLVADGAVRAYLPPYHTRHTFVSIQRHKGVPDDVIAAWCETSEKMISKHYSDAQKELYRPADI